MRGVESRTVAIEGGYLTYLINLNRSRADVKLVSRRPIRRAVDFVANETVTPRLIRLQPLSPMLLRLDAE